MFGKVSGQISADPLISNEQFTIGGADSVRGYLEAEDLGDVGILGSIELRTPHLHSAWKDRFPELYVFGFADGGNVKVKQPLPGQVQGYTLASRGLGFKLSGRAGLHFSFDYARTRRPATYTAEGANRVEFLLGQDF